MERAKPATFADFMDGLSRAMGLPVAPAAPAHRVTLPAAPLDPCPPLAFVVGSGYVATVRCPVYLPLIVKEDAP